MPLIPAEQRVELIFCFADSSENLEDLWNEKICDVEGTGWEVRCDSGELGAYSRGSVTRVSALRNLYLIFYFDLKLFCALLLVIIYISARIKIYAALDKYKNARVWFKRAKTDATCYIQSVQKCGAVKKVRIMKFSCSLLTTYKYEIMIITFCVIFFY